MPAVAKWFVSHDRPLASAGTVTLLNQLDPIPVLNKVKLSPATKALLLALDIMVSVPPDVMLVAPATWSLVRVAPVLLIRKLAVPANDKVLPSVRVPIEEVPGASVPPEFTVTEPLMAPLPRSVAVFSTVTALPEESEPGLFTRKMPPLTVVAPL